MPGHKYKCEACGAELWMAQKTRCPCCGAPVSAMAPNVPQKASCAVCKKAFKPRDGRQKACAVCVPRYRAIKQAEMARKRYADGTGGHRTAPYTGPKEPNRQPWAWMSGCLDDSGRMSSKRTILHVLEDKTKAGEWPWQDPLAGVGPCLMDECPL